MLLRILAVTIVTLLALFVSLGFSNPPHEFRNEEYCNKVRDSLIPLQKKLGTVKPGDWLESHPETGQTFAKYLREKPVLARAKRRSIYIQNIGEFSEAQQKIVKLSAECLGLYYGLEIKWMPDIADTADWPDDAKRVHPSWGTKQLLGPYILDEILAPNVPEDAAVLLGFTGQDLWPGEGWNFVFGLASLRKRVGVWSIHRNGKPSGSDEEFRLCLLRTIRTATHETGHMFTIRHCTAYECNMCGSNHQDESDRRPPIMCAECLPKLCWATGLDPKKRYRGLASFYDRVGLKAEAARCRELNAVVPALKVKEAKSPTKDSPSE